MKTTTNKTKATKDAVSRIGCIAIRQRQIAEILNKAAAQVQALERENAADERAIENAVTRQQADVRAIAAALAKGNVRVGDLGCRLVDAIERRGQRAFPEPYEVIAKPWCIVSNNF
jgi:hypothetical protein